MLNGQTPVTLRIEACLYRAARQLYNGSTLAEGLADQTLADEISGIRLEVARLLGDLERKRRPRRSSLDTGTYLR